MTEHPFTELTAFKRDLLFVLAKLGPSKGLAIKTSLQTIYEKEINHGRLYPNLDGLVEAGYIDKSERDRRTNEYTLTDKGWTTLQSYVGWQVECLKEGGHLEDLNESIEDDTQASSA